MKTKNQLLLLKIVYVLVLILALVYNFADLQKGFIDAANGTEPKNFHPIGVIILMPIAIIGIGIVFKVYFFINSIQNDSVFSLVNIHRITMIGWFCILQAVLLYVFYFFEAESKMSQSFTCSKMVSINFDFWLVIFGLTMLIVGYVFRKGIELQKEQDLTI